ncbi:SH3-like domain-containing protein [Erwinia sp. S59]|uniref:SH3-like domain-containing protein n=1 Tax=Erwiniaceae TaxID=1903409 RepID=UPI00190AF72A|nr:nitrile hydratase subunit beta [Erwinia sp. S59]MBK0127631.1 nitrile hydratase subunit beta [Pantoea sp. S61]
MNNIHDCGGMQNLGPIEMEANEPNFHSQWEKDIFATTLIFFMSGKIVLDDFRYEIEKMPVTEYLQSSYYEHWLFAIEQLMCKTGVFTEQELQQRLTELSA